MVLRLPGGKREKEGLRVYEGRAPNLGVEKKAALLGRREGEGDKVSCGKMKALLLRKQEAAITATVGLIKKEQFYGRNDRRIKEKKRKKLAILPIGKGKRKGALPLGSLNQRRKKERGAEVRISLENGKQVGYAQGGEKEKKTPCIPPQNREEKSRNSSQWDRGRSIAPCLKCEKRGKKAVSRSKGRRGKKKARHHAT